MTQKATFTPTTKNAGTIWHDVHVRQGINVKVECPVCHLANHRRKLADARKAAN